MVLMVWNHQDQPPPLLPLGCDTPRVPCLPTAVKGQHLPHSSERRVSRWPGGTQGRAQMGFPDRANPQECTGDSPKSAGTFLISHSELHVALGASEGRGPQAGSLRANRQPPLIHRRPPMSTAGGCPGCAQDTYLYCAPNPSCG